MLAKKLTASVALALFVSCGSVAGSAGDGSTRNAVLHDPENPYWTGSTVVDSSANESRPSVIRDPENPYWVGSTAYFADEVPVRGGGGHGLR